MWLAVLFALLPQQALLEDGTRVDVGTDCRIGDTQFQTPFGRYLSGARVVRIESADETLRLLEPLRELNYAQWVARLAERGHLQALLQAVRQPELAEEQHAALFEALRTWGQRLDPLPLEAESSTRTADLWQGCQQAQDGEIALWVGALEQAIHPAVRRDGQQIGLRAWRQMLDSPSRARRWAAARLAARMQDPNTELDLLEASLEDSSDWVADTSGQALWTIDPLGASYRWAYELIPNRSAAQQLRAARMLGLWSHGDPDQARLLAKRIRQYPSRVRGSDPLRRQFPHLVTPITDDSVLEVRSLSDRTMERIARVLDRLSEAKPADRDAETWRSLLLGR